MEKNVLVYRATTALSAIGAGAAAVAYFTKNPTIMASFEDLGYPAYVPPLLGAWKVLGAAALVVPVPATLREWAYAGFTFTYSGAIVSHLSRVPRVKAVASAVSLALLLTSYALRPAHGD